MSTAEDLTRQANVLAAKLQRARAAPRAGKSPDPVELAAMESRLSGLWAQIRAARVAEPQGRGAPNRRPRSKWD